MPKENSENRLIIICYAFIVFILVSEPFIFQITDKEYTRMYGLLLFCIGAVALSVVVKNKKEVKNKNELQIHKQNVMSTTKRRNKNK